MKLLIRLLTKLFAVTIFFDTIVDEIVCGDKNLKDNYGYHANNNLREIVDEIINGDNNMKGD